MTFRVAQQISDIPASDWDRLVGSDNPFVSHGYLEAMESSGCAGAHNGWQPHHALLYEGDTLVAAAPGYLKTHSYGEFVFDFGWAQAAQRAGLPYYPKWLIAVPFTPVTGPRLLAEGPTQRQALLEAMTSHAEKERLPGLHVLFGNAQDHAALQAADLLPREDCQYLWQNQGFSDFDVYLNSLSRSDRKNIRRERRRVAEAGIDITAVPASKIGKEDWPVIFQCYCNTYHERGQEPYWNAGLLQSLAARFPDQLLLFLARREGHIIAMAITLRSGERLYGRHWGCLEQVDCLHFETCFYQPIEYCIRHGLSVFDAGAQGEHKLKRGFLPETTRSYHWLQNPQLREAVAHYLTRERAAVGQYIEWADVRARRGQGTAGS